MAQVVASADDDEALGQRVRTLEGWIHEVDGKAEVLRQHHDDMRDTTARGIGRMDRIELQQNTLDATMWLHAKHLADIDGHLKMIMSTQEQHGQRLRVLDDVVVVQQEHSKQLKALAEMQSHQVERLKVLDHVVAVQREHSEQLKVLDAVQRDQSERMRTFAEVQRDHSEQLKTFGEVQRQHGERLDKLDGKLDLMLEHMGLTASGSAS
jgi:hypothetical protein